ncbi:MAG: biopolymer transporter ExbD [Proteobacteria bacterium]|nr:biopolymer transporter ExbD [Pseudomonadota bacterium]MBU1742066.1 biopolymer transporter ExbD [Pseudomonadota bacterium]
MKVKVTAARRARIEMIPLIDVIFLLLVFFIYAMLSMTVHRGLPVKLPLAGDARQAQDRHIAVTIHADGALALNKSPVDLRGLVAGLKAKYAADKKQPVYIFGDQKTPYQRIIEVFDAVRRSGFSHVSLQVRPSRPKVRPK